MITVTTNNVPHKNKWNLGVVQVHMETPHTSLIKSNHNDKADKDFVIMKVRRYPTSYKSELYEFKMALFDNGNPEEFWLFVCNFNTTLAESEIMETAAKVQYICTLVCWEVLRQFESMSSDVEDTNPLTAEAIILGLGAYFPLLIFYWRKACDALRIKSKTLHGLFDWS